MGPIKHHDFVALVKRWNCTVLKMSKEWEVVDKEDGMRVCSFASHGQGSEILPVYVKKFLKAIRAKRGDKE